MKIQKSNDITICKVQTDVNNGTSPMAFPVNIIYQAEIQSN